MYVEERRKPSKEGDSQGYQTVVIKESGQPSRYYWNKDEIKVDEDNYLRVNDSKIKACNSDLLAGKSPSFFASMKALQDHSNNSVKHTTAEEKRNWNRAWSWLNKNTVKDQVKKAINSDFLDGISSSQFTRCDINQSMDAALFSKRFVPGMTGEGLAVDFNKSSITLDHLTVRKEATFFDLVIQQMKYNGGVQVLSAGAIKVLNVEEKETKWRCFFDTLDNTIRNPFVKDDIIRCQRFDISPKYYCSIVVEVGPNYIDITKESTEGNLLPTPGDHLVQFGNVNIPSRQSLIVISSMGSSAPCIDLLKGVNSFSLDGKLVQRMGNLEDIQDPSMGNLSGYGLYAENVFLKGRFALDNGEDIGTVLSSKASSSEITSQIVGVNNEMAKRTAATNKQIADSKRALENYAQAKANLAKQEAIANADGKITAEEKARIEQAKQTLQSAKDHANNAVATIQIGGRNLIEQSQSVQVSSCASGITSQIIEGDIIQIVSQKSNGNWVSLFFPNISRTESKLKEGDIFTFSFLVRSEGHNKIPKVYFKADMGYYQMQGNITSEFSKCYYTGQWKKESGMRIHLGFGDIIGTTECKDFKLEEGNKVTSWTPAPEDMDLKVREVKETLESSISQTNKEISLKVSKSYVDAQVSQVQNVGINLVGNSIYDKWTDEYGFCVRSFKAEAGEDYTLSFEGMIGPTARDNGKVLRAYVYDNNNWSWATYANINSLEKTKASCTIKSRITGELFITFYLFPRGGTVKGKVYLDRFKVEKGKNPTDWTPALTDQVYSNKIISEINQTAEEIKISAEKIEINGSTTFAPGYNPTDKIGLGKLDHTIIEGGKLKTDLIKTREITALGNVEAGSFNLGNGKFVVDEEGNIISKSGKIGGWGISDRSIKSSNWDAPPEESDHNPNWWDYNGRLMLDSEGGFLQAQGSTSDTRNRISEFSFKGVFANFPGQYCRSATTGIDYKASVVGIVYGYDSRDRSYERDRPFGQDKRKRFGVYGRGLGKQTDNLAPTYGGGFEGGGAYCSRLIHGTLKDQNIPGIENGWLTKDWVTIDVTDIGYLSLGATKNFGNIKLTGGVHGQQLTIFNKNKWKPIYIKDNAMLGKETQQISGGVSLTFIYDVSPTHPPQKYGSGQEGVWVPIGGYSPNDW